MALNLGTIYTDGKLHNHRTWLKILCNPFLRMLGFEIASLFNNDMFIKYQIQPCSKKVDFKSSWRYDLHNNQTIRKS